MQSSSVDILWKAEYAFFSASNASLTFQDGTFYSFVDDLGRPEVLNSGGTGEEISREDDWTENSIERRFKMYFEGSSTRWNLYEARIYDNKEPPDWLFALIDGTHVGVRTGNTLFYCDYFEINYDCLDDIDACNTARFSAQDVFIGAYLLNNSDACSMNVYKPCGDDQACIVVDGIINCSNELPMVYGGDDSRKCQQDSKKISCPVLTEPCMNEDNLEQCLDLQAQGCENILILESCPLQFLCNDVTPNPTIFPVTSPCPSATDPCMTDENYAQCMNLVETGCQDIWTSKSCPLQFECGDATADPTQFPTTPCPNITEPCINEDNLAVCMSLYADGCDNILTLESCPVQFVCGDSTRTEAPNSTIVPIATPCPAATEPCMNDENYAVCMDLVEIGCEDIKTLDSCPLQFECGEITYEPSQNSSKPCPSITEPCMDEDSLSVCMSLYEDGCSNILVLESCPLQFSCGDRTGAPTEDEEATRSPPTGGKIEPSPLINESSAFSGVCLTQIISFSSVVISLFVMWI